MKAWILSYRTLLSSSNTFYLYMKQCYSKFWFLKFLLLTFKASWLKMWFLIYYFIVLKIETASNYQLLGFRRAKPCFRAKPWILRCFGRQILHTVPIEISWQTFFFLKEEIKAHLFHPQPPPSPPSLPPSPSPKTKVPKKWVNFWAKKFDA